MHVNMRKAASTMFLEVYHSYWTHVEENLLNSMLMISVSIKFIIVNLHMIGKKLASRLSAHYGVAVYVETELSASWHHMNAFGSWIPIIDCNVNPEGHSEYDAVAYVKSYGGVVSLNHPPSPNGRNRI